eukprot:4618746-Alexandrium_andersonii.AAC.1
MPGGPELQLLDSKRETRRRRLSTSSSEASCSSGVHVRVDNFDANPQYEFTEERAGVTVFRQLGSFPAELQ